MYPNQPQPPQPPAKPTYTPASIAAGCLSLVALLAVGGCVGMAITTSGGDEPATEATPDTTTPAITDNDGLDEWTESIFELTWDDMSQTERDELCAEVNEFGPDVAARVIDNEVSDDADLDRHTIEQILTDYCA